MALDDFHLKATNLLRVDNQEIQKEKSAPPPSETVKIKFTGHRIVALMDEMKTSNAIFQIAKAFARNEDMVQVYHFSEGFNDPFSQSVRELSDSIYCNSDNYVMIDLMCFSDFFNLKRINTPITKHTKEH